MRVYIAGPMSRASFCRCDRPATPGALTVVANPVGVSHRDAEPIGDVRVRQPICSEGSHRSLDIGSSDDVSHRPLLPESDLLDGPRTPSRSEPRSHVVEQVNSSVTIGSPLEEGLLAEPLRRVRAADTTDATAFDHEVEDVSIGRRNLDAQRPLVGGAVDDRALPLVEASAPSDVSECPFHGFTLPDDGIDPWDNNYPTFNQAAKDLADAGFEPLNPVDVGARCVPGVCEHDWQWYMRRTLAMMLTADRVALLPGWENSRGAQIERRLAYDIDVPVTPIERLLDGTVQP